MDWLKNKVIIFHAHTRYSFDSLIGPRAMVDTCIRNGVELLVITDHDTIDGAAVARDYAKSKGYPNFEVVIGEEISTDLGDVIGFPLTTVVSPGRFDAVRDRIKEQKGMICLPHPYRSHNLFKIHEKDVQESIDFIETFNSRLNDKLNGYAEELRLKFGKFAIAGTDAHLSSDLNKAPFKFDGQMNMQLVQSDKTSKRNFRLSQAIGSARKGAYLQVPKYILLAAINR